MTRSREMRRPFQEVVESYCIERFLGRLSKTPHADHVVVKGAYSLRTLEVPIGRPTRDIDILLAVGTPRSHVETILRDVAEMTADGDAVEFDVVDAQWQDIRGARGQAWRVRLSARLDRMNVMIQLDIVTGEEITPEPTWRTMPTILEGPEAPRLRMYAMETIVAEKLEAIVTLGLINGRLKDYYDLWVIGRTQAVDRTALTRAVHATFAARETPIPDSIPPGLTETFADAIGRQEEWSSFLEARGLEAPSSLRDVLTELRAFLVPLLASALTWQNQQEAP